MSNEYRVQGLLGHADWVVSLHVDLLVHSPMGSPSPHSLMEFPMCFDVGLAVNLCGSLSCYLLSSGLNSKVRIVHADQAPCLQLGQWHLPSS